jgi:hypothetical protein
MVLPVANLQDIANLILRSQADGGSIPPTEAAAECQDSQEHSQVF